MKDQVHHSAAAGDKTGADTYVRGRPDYPPQVADWLTGTLGLNADKAAITQGPGDRRFRIRRSGRCRNSATAMATQVRLRM